MQRFKFQEEFPKFLADEHVAAVLDITRNPGEDGTIFVQSGGSYEKGKTIAVPRVTLSVEHFGRMARLLEKKVHVEVEMNVETTFYDDDDKAYNTLAEIPGVDPTLKDQVVMLGGHLDSWHGAKEPRTTARARWWGWNPCACSRSLASSRGEPSASHSGREKKKDCSALAAT